MDSFVPWNTLGVRAVALRIGTSLSSLERCLRRALGYARLVESLFAASVLLVSFVNRVLILAARGPWTITTTVLWKTLLRAIVFLIIARYTLTLFVSLLN